MSTTFYELEQIVRGTQRVELAATRTVYVGSPHDLFIQNGEFVSVGVDDPLTREPWMMPLDAWYRREFMRKREAWCFSWELACAWSWDVPYRERMERLAPLIGTRDHRLNGRFHQFRKSAVAKLATEHFSEWSRPRLRDLKLRLAWQGLRNEETH